MTTLKAIQKRYELLDPVERLRLFVLADAGGDPEEASRIAKACPTFTYTSRDHRFTERVTALMLIAQHMTNELQGIHQVWLCARAYSMAGAVITEAADSTLGNSTPIVSDAWVTVAATGFDILARRAGALWLGWCRWCAAEFDLHGAAVVRGMLGGSGQLDELLEWAEGQAGDAKLLDPVDGAELADRRREAFARSWRDWSERWR